MITLVSVISCARFDWSPTTARSILCPTGLVLIQPVADFLVELEAVAAFA